MEIEVIAWVITESNMQRSGYAMALVKTLDLVPVEIMSTYGTGFEIEIGCRRFIR